MDAEEASNLGGFRGVEPANAGAMASRAHIQSDSWLLPLSGFPRVADRRIHFAVQVRPDATPVAVTGVRLRHGLIGKRTPPPFRQTAHGRWDLMFEARDVARMEYQFELLLDDRRSLFVTDPSCIHSAGDPFGGKSVVLLGGYAEPLYAAPVARAHRGTLREIELPAPPLRTSIETAAAFDPGDGQARATWPSWVWSPPAHISRTIEMLPIMLFLDGSDYLRYAGAREMLEHLVAWNQLPPCRAVFVKPNDRNAEYAANNDTAELLGNDRSEFWQALREHVPLSRDADARIAIGASLGGLCLLHAHASHLHGGALGGLILQSGSFFQPGMDDMERSFKRFGQITSFVQLITSGRMRASDVPVVLTCGSGEENIVNNRAMAQALASQGIATRLLEHADAHNWTSWRDTLGPAFRELLNNR